MHKPNNKSHTPLSVLEVVTAACILDHNSLHLYYVVNLHTKLLQVITVRRYARTVYAITLCLSICLTVTSQHSDKMAKYGITQMHAGAQRLGEISIESSSTGAPNAGGVG